jgi:hypothetical protein
MAVHRGRPPSLGDESADIFDLAPIAYGAVSPSFADVLPMLTLAYLAAAVLQRRQATWLLAVDIDAVFAALRLQDWVDPVVALIVAALVLVLWGAVRRRLRRGTLVVEMLRIVGFTSIALAAVSVDQDLGRYVVAAGWFGHAASFQLRPGHEQYLLHPVQESLYKKHTVKVAARDAEGLSATQSWSFYVVRR